MENESNTEKCVYSEDNNPHFTKTEKEVFFSSVQFG